MSQPKPPTPTRFSIDVDAMAETLRYLYHANEPCDAPNKHRHDHIAVGIAGQYPRIAAQAAMSRREDGQ